jgi:Serpentine type 7TM GPCR chemoreceptor Srw
MFTATVVPNSFFTTGDINNGDRNTFVTTASADDDVTLTSAPPAPLLQRYSDWYSGYHGYASLAVCAIGIVGNVLNVAVLTRANMATSSTNFILTALAVSDLLKMASYVPFAIQFYCRRHADQPSDPGMFLNLS